MEDYLKVVAPYLQPALVSTTSLSQIQTLAQHLPLGSLAGFECRLGAGESRVDFLINLPCIIPKIPEHFLAHPVWQKVINFCQEWTRPKSSLHQMVKHIWLEFDLDEERSLIPIPCIFLALNQNSIGKEFSLREVTQTGLLPTSSNLESNLQLCTDALPEGAWIAHLGAMLSRPAQAVRVVVKGMHPQQLLDYLVKVGWTEATPTFSDLVSTVSEFVDALVLDLDVGDTIYPKIGLECFLHQQPLSEPRWQSFLDDLVAKDLCTPAKKNALLAWVGVSQKADCPEIWPSNLTMGDLLLGSKAFSVIYRTINHIKLIYQQDLPLSAKAYLAFGHTWLPRSAVQANVPPVETTQDETQYLERVCSYYEQMTPTILKYVGQTYQSGLLKSNLAADPYRATNLYCAARAGIQPEHRVLDAGCGVGGPSIDIAKHIKGAKIDAITLSPTQAKIAKELVQQAGLAERIQVHLGDFHHLPFADEVFDIVFFLEAAGYSCDHQRLFSEVYRVLRPGGKLYIKEPFIKELPLSEQEQQELVEFNRVYVYQATRRSEMSASIASVGFHPVMSCDLSHSISTQEFNQAMFDFQDGFTSLTEFGKHHYRDCLCLPIVFGEIQAYKPISSS